MTLNTTFYKHHKKKEPTYQIIGAGEDYDKYEVGVRDVAEIEEFLAPKWGNLTSYVVHFDGGKAVRIFNPNYVEYFPFEEE